jgi:hypothetical protein
LRLGRPHQVQQLSNGLLFKPMLVFPIKKPYMLFVKIFHCRNSHEFHTVNILKEAWKILETTYEGTKIIKSAKLQMLISRFKEIKMLEVKTFNEFYTKISDMRNSKVSLGKKVSDAKHIKF